MDVWTGAVGLRLAIAFAQAGRSTTLIDVTPPGASAPRLIECPGSGSLQRANGDDGLSPGFLTDVPNLAVILAGTPDLPGGDLHLEDRIAALLTRHRAEPDGVAIIATPALAVAPSALAVARYAGGVLLCVTPGRTKRSDAIRARDALQEAGGRVWGVILGNEDEAR